MNRPLTSQSSSGPKDLLACTSGVRSLLSRFLFLIDVASDHADRGVREAEDLAQFLETVLVDTNSLVNALVSRLLVFDSLEELVQTQKGHGGSSLHLMTKVKI